MSKSKCILLASANQYGGLTGYLDFLRVERQKIAEAISFATSKGFARVNHEPECTFENLFDRFNQAAGEGSINFFHYFGHSDAEQIYLHDEAAGNRRISNQRLVDFLKCQEALEVVFLNSCCSETLGELILAECESVKAVIETTSKVGDAEAAQFAQKVYKGLNAGKSLKLAFKQALHETRPGFSCREGARSIGFFEEVGGELQPLWKLSFAQVEFVEKWVLVERPHQRFDDPEVDTRILAIYEDIEQTQNERYYKLLQKSFLSDRNTLVYSLADVADEEQKETFIKGVDLVVIFLSEALSVFWNQLDWLKPLLKNTPIFFLGCDGGIEDTAERIAIQLASKKDPIYPKPPFTLAKLSQVESPELAFNRFCADELCRAITNPHSQTKGVLSGEFDNLNFRNQRKPFEKKDEHLFQFGQYNFILIEGSPYCAQELLVKKLLSYANPRIESNIKRHVISIQKNISGFLTSETLRQQIFHTLLGLEMDLGVDALRAALLQKMKQQDLILVLTDVFQNNGDCLKVLETFWNEITFDLFPNPNQGRLFLFAIHKDCKQAKNHWEIQQFRSAPPMLNVRLLDAIQPLDEQTLNIWHANTGKWFSEGNAFHSLIHEEKTNQILKEPYMAKAIAEICHLMRCPELLSEVINL